MKKKILILINSDIYIRNYLESGAFKKIIHFFDVKFISFGNGVFNKRKLNKILKKKYIGSIFYSLRDLKKFQQHLYYNFLLNKKKSKTISYLTKVMLKIKLYWKGETVYETIYKFPLRIISWIKKNFEYYVISKFRNKNFEKELNLEIIDICKKIKPDLIIFPYQDAHIASYDVMCQKFVKKTLGLTDNWDNLSSRASLEIKPKFVTVWGAQTKKHAIKFQNYKKKQIFSIGTPRFSNYFEKRNKRIKSLFKFPYILFLESFNNYDNYKILYELDNFILKSKKFSKFKIIYRPHPWQKNNKEILDVRKFQNLIIDPQIKKNYLNRKFSTSFQPDLNYYNNLIQNSEIVITGPTSMLIEASIFYKKILLLGHESKSSTPYKLELENFEHLEGVQRLPNVVINKKMSDFIFNLKRTFNLKISKKEIDRVRNYYLDYSGKKYQERLYKVVNKILNV